MPSGWLKEPLGLDPAAARVATYAGFRLVLPLTQRGRIGVAARPVQAKLLASAEIDRVGCACGAGTRVPGRWERWGVAFFGGKSGPTARLGLYPDAALSLAGVALPLAWERFYRGWDVGAGGLRVVTGWGWRRGGADGSRFPLLRRSGPADREVMLVRLASVADGQGSLARHRSARCSVGLGPASTVVPRSTAVDCLRLLSDCFGPGAPRG